MILKEVHRTKMAALTQLLLFWLAIVPGAVTRSLTARRFRQSEDEQWARSGTSFNHHSCAFVRNVYDAPTFIRKFGVYYKYTEAYGIPVVSTSSVDDRALRRACYVLRFMLADRADFRRLLYKKYVRIAIYAAKEDLKTLPEYKEIPSTLVRRGVPPAALSTVVAVPENNLLCRLKDEYLPEDILVRNLGRIMVRLAFQDQMTSPLWHQFSQLHKWLKEEGFPKWKDTYATKSVLEWMAEGIQSYFDVNYETTCPDSLHNYVNTRQELKNYDPTFYKLIKQIFPCGNKLFSRCMKGSPPEPKMNCPVANTTFSLPSRSTSHSTSSHIGKSCHDSPWWNCKEQLLKRKEGCNGVVRLYCRRTCRNCLDCRPLDLQDHNPNCAEWGKQGYCQTTEDAMASWYVRHICRSTCGRN